MQSQGSRLQRWTVIKKYKRRILRSAQAENVDWNIHWPPKLNVYLNRRPDGFSLASGCCLFDRISLAASSTHSSIKSPASIELPVRAILCFVTVLIDASLLALCLRDAFLRWHDSWACGGPKNLSNSLFVLFPEKTRSEGLCGWSSRRSCKRSYFNLCFWWGVKPHLSSPGDAISTPRRSFGSVQPASGLSLITPAQAFHL